MSQMRTKEEAIELYMRIRSEFSPRKKRKFAQFEGQKIFRFGNSWRRRCINGSKTVVLNDDSEKLIVI